MTKKLFLIFIMLSYMCFAGERGDAFKKGHEAEDYNEAIKWYKKALTLCKENESVPKAWAYNNIGYAYIRIGKWELALENLEKSVKEYSKIPVAWNNLGIVYENLALYKKENKENEEKKKELLIKAKESYEKAVNLKPAEEKYKLNKERAESLIQNR
ncbi:MAG: tetratricopeptide repeat protein [Candidatus Firestonebacteria bacterium]